jgi:hypothetical protein
MTLYSSGPKEDSSVIDLLLSSPDLVDICCRYIHSHCLSVCVYFSCTMSSDRLLVQCQQIAKFQEVCLLT